MSMETRQDILKRDDIIKDLLSMPKVYKNTMIDLLDYIKIDFLNRTTKVISEVNHILYRNGGLMTISEIKDALWAVWQKSDTVVWEITRNIKHK